VLTDISILWQANKNLASIKKGFKMKKNIVKKAMAIISDNDTESSIISDLNFNFNNDYSDIELEIEELQLEKEFQARQRMIAAKKPQTVQVKKNVSNSNRAARTSDTNKSRQWLTVTSALLESEDKKSIIAGLVAFEGMKEISAKSFVNSISCCITALKGNARKKEGIVNRVAMALVNNEKVPQDGDKNSINYVLNTFKTMKNLNAI